jgi:hypothetical protein
MSPSIFVDDVEEALDIDVDVLGRMVERVPHAGQRGQVQHAVAALHALGELGAVQDVAMDERETLALLQHLQALGLQLRVVVGVHVVEPHHLVAAVQERVGRVEADESGGAGQKDFHIAREYSRWPAFR